MVKVRKNVRSGAANWAGIGFVCHQVIRYISHFINLLFLRQILYMQPVPKPVFMQKAAHQQLRFGILAAYTRHVIATRLFGVYIGHKAKVIYN